MKTQIRIIFILVISAMALYGCEEDSEDLLKDLAEGKMVVVAMKWYWTVRLGSMEAPEE